MGEEKNIISCIARLENDFYYKEWSIHHNQIVEAVELNERDSEVKVRLKDSGFLILNMTWKDFESRFEHLETEGLPFTVTYIRNVQKEIEETDGTESTVQANDDFDYKDSFLNRGDKDNG